MRRVDLGTPGERPWDRSWCPGDRSPPSPCCSPVLPWHRSGTSDQLEHRHQTWGMLRECSLDYLRMLPNCTESRIQWVSFCLYNRKDSLLKYEQSPRYNWNWLNIHRSVQLFWVRDKDLDKVTYHAYLWAIYSPYHIIYYMLFFRVIYSFNEKLIKLDFLRWRSQS